jgi:hypothetical protein
MNSFIVSLLNGSETKILRNEGVGDVGRSKMRRCGIYGGGTKESE